MLGTLDGGNLSLEELHRFPNTPLTQDGELHWNIASLFDEIKIGLRKAAALKIPIASISTDSWGLDYVLFDGTGEIIRPTFHYRDSRTFLCRQVSLQLTLQVVLRPAHNALINRVPTLRRNVEHVK